MIYLALFLVAYLSLVGCMQRKVIYPVAGQPLPQGLAIPPGVETWATDHRQGQTQAFFMPGDGVTPDAPGPVVIYAHGNGELIQHYPFYAQRYTQQGISVLVPEYRGYGSSDGKPTKARIDADFAAFYQQLTQHPLVDGDRIVFHGRSLGGGVIASLAQQHPPAALILESTFTSTSDMAKRLFTPPFLILDRYDVNATLAEYDGPVLIVHGTRDQIIPIAMSQRNHDTARQSTYHTYEMTHNDPWPQAFLDDIDAFLVEARILP